MSDSSSSTIWAGLGASFCVWTADSAMKVAEPGYAPPIATYDSAGMTSSSTFQEAGVVELGGSATQVSDSARDVRMLWVKNLRDLVEGWDGSCAPAPNESAIAAALLVASENLPEGCRDWRAVPDIEGGIVVYMFGGEALQDGGWSLEAGLSISNEDGNALYLKDRVSDEILVEDVDGDPAALRTSLSRAARFLSRGSNA